MCLQLFWQRFATFSFMQLFCNCVFQLFGHTNCLATFLQKTHKKATICNFFATFCCKKKLLKLQKKLAKKLQQTCKKVAEQLQTHRTRDTINPGHKDMLRLCQPTMTLHHGRGHRHEHEHMICLPPGQVW